MVFCLKKSKTELNQSLKREIIVIQILFLICLRVRRYNFLENKAQIVSDLEKLSAVMPLSAAELILLFRAVDRLGLKQKNTKLIHHLKSIL